MTASSLVATPGPDPRSVRTPDGTILRVPADWCLVPPGDPGLTRRVKAAGPSWTVQEKKGRRTFSRGVWAPAATVERVEAELAIERTSEGYTRRRAADARRREAAQADYVGEFHQAVLAYLAFHPTYADLADRLARAVAAHATPVGSGTVARTQRIPVGERAAAAVIAWLRHQTTAYDSMAIPRVRGKRREVRRELARRSKDLLASYRRGDPPPPRGCPLALALAGRAGTGEESPPTGAG
ncbi:MAG: hypothetical protein JWO38_6997 [Gemmataceae bacterium]|nr:hypothetical protein [Gemmataceae bacterium]